MVAKEDPPLLVFFPFLLPGEANIGGRKIYFLGGPSPLKIYYLELGDAMLVHDSA